LTDLKPVIWVSSSKKDLRKFPKKVKETFGEAIMYAQCGEKHSKAKIYKHQGSGSILEVVEDGIGGTFRAVYTVKFEKAVVILHAFQKKSKTGKETSKQDKDLIDSRMQMAKQIYENWLKKLEIR
jgi:phage-related protein